MKIKLVSPLILLAAGSLVIAAPAAPTFAQPGQTVTDTAAKTRLCHRPKSPKAAGPRRWRPCSSVERSARLPAQPVATAETSARPGHS